MTEKVEPAGAPRKLKPDVKALWLKKLRSREYLQGRDLLRSDDHTEYCCLGVLTDLAVQAGVVSDEDAFPYYEDTQYPCRKVTRWAAAEEWDDLSETFWRCTTPLHSSLATTDLADVNDSGWSFEEIADIIEEQF